MSIFNNMESLVAKNPIEGSIPDRSFFFAKGSNENGKIMLLSGTVLPYTASIVADIVGAVLLCYRQDDDIIVVSKAW